MNLKVGRDSIDPASPELNGQPFTRTFLHGTYNGTFIFWEPLITLAFLKTKPSETHDLKLPQSYAVIGPYPLRYSIDY